jgi:hypothetical protein
MTMYQDIEPREGEIPARDEDEATTDLARELVAEAKRFAKAELSLTRRELREVVEEASHRLRLDVAVAKRELAIEAKRIGRAGLLTGGGGLLLHAAMYLLLFTLVFALAKALPLWAATLIVMAVTAAGGAALSWIGNKRLRGIARPIAAIRNFKGDGQWMMERMRGLRSQIRVRG